MPHVDLTCWETIDADVSDDGDVVVKVEGEETDDGSEYSLPVDEREETDD